MNTAACRENRGLQWQRNRFESRKNLTLEQGGSARSMHCFIEHYPRSYQIYMNDEDAKKFFAAADTYPDIRYKTAAMILLLTGMRRGELCGLEWSNIDIKEATITIERSVTTVAGIGIVEKEPKTESSKRVIAISDKLLSVLAEYKAWYDQYRRDMGDQWKETDRLFIAECGAQIYPGTVYTWVHKVCDAAGLPHRTVHSLRHTNITMQIAAGVPLVTVAC